MVVEYDFGTHSAAQFEFEDNDAASGRELAEKIGRIYEIYSQDDITVKKDVSTTGDLLIIGVDIT